MAFEGDLKNLPLADVLQSIHQNSLTGTLSVKDGRGERKVAFASGFIVAFLPAPGESHPVIDSLAKRRIVGRNEAEKARSGFLGKRKTLRLALASRGLVKEEDYQKVVKEDVLEGIYELFLENDRTFRFEDGTPDLAQWDPDQVCAELRLAPPGIVMEGARRTDEWARIRRAIGSFHEVLVRDSDSAPDGEDDAMVREILTLADGTRDLGSILDSLPVPRFRGCEVAAGLIQQRLLRPASTNEYVSLGQRAEDKGDYDEAAKFYERGLATERGNLDLRSRRAGALEKAGRKADAAHERMLLAEALYEQGKRQDAGHELIRAADLEPRDPHPLEKRFKIANDDGDKETARTVAARLATLYEDLGLGEKARELLKQHVAREQEDEEMREKLAELALRLGDTKGAAREWNQLAGRAARRENLSLAAARYRRAVEIDPGDEASRGALKDIETGELLARRVRRKQQFRLAVASTVFFAAAGWVVWEGMAVTALHEAEVAELDKVATGTPESIEEAIAHVIAVGQESRFKWTLLARSQAEATTFKLIGLYADAFDRSKKEPVVPPAHAGVKLLSDNDVFVQLPPAIDPPGKPTLEALVHTGDDTLPTDREGAGRAFEQVLARIRNAREEVLAKASNAALHNSGVEDVIKRISPALARARVGQVRALSLDAKSREELERRVAADVPAVPNK